MPEYVRVYDKELKRRYTVGVANPDVHDVLDEPALDGAGVPLEPEFDVTPTGRRTASADSKGANK